MQIEDLLAFYQSPLGHKFQDCVQQCIHSFSSVREGDISLGIGYTIPYAFDDQALGKSLHCFISPLGGLKRKHHPTGRHLLIDETLLPFANQSVNRIYVIHALECIHAIDVFFQELFRILSRDGDAIIVIAMIYRFWFKQRHPLLSSSQCMPFSMLQKKLLNSGFHIFDQKQFVLWNNLSKPIPILFGKCLPYATRHALHYRVVHIKKKTPVFIRQGCVRQYVAKSKKAVLQS